MYPHVWGSYCAKFDDDFISFQGITCDGHTHTPAHRGRHTLYTWTHTHASTKRIGEENNNNNNNNKDKKKKIEEEEEEEEEEVKEEKEEQQKAAAEEEEKEEEEDRDR